MATYELTELNDVELDAVGAGNHGFYQNSFFSVFQQNNNNQQVFAGYYGADDVTLVNYQNNQAVVGNESYNNVG